MKKQSFLNKLFKKKSDDEQPERPGRPTREESVLTLNDGEPVFPDIDIEGDIEYEDISSAPLDLPIPEMDESRIIGEIEVFVKDVKVANHQIETQTRIGRDPSRSDIIISELIVSKLHCTLYEQDNTVYIKDNDSTNGTYIDNQKVSIQQLQNDTTIWLGRRGTVKINFRKK